MLYVVQCLWKAPQLKWSVLDIKYFVLHCQVQYSFCSGLKILKLPVQTHWLPSLSLSHRTACRCDTKGNCMLSQQCEAAALEAMLALTMLTMGSFSLPALTCTGAGKCRAMYLWLCFEIGCFRIERACAKLAQVNILQQSTEPTGQCLVPMSPPTVWLWANRWTTRHEIHNCYLVLTLLLFLRDFFYITLLNGLR